MPDTEHVSLERASQLLRQLLQARSPELGARLKQRLMASLREQGTARFDERVLGYKSFQVFLEKTQGDWLQVTRPTASSGDILVELREQGRAATLPSRLALGPRFRSEVWQAFTNPDSTRKRFLHRSTGQVLHFKAGEGSLEEAAYLRHPEEYAEIEFIEGNRQLQWMEEFLNAVPIVGDERTTYESMRSTPYSSAMNTAFSRALGDKQNQWREFRTSRVAAAMAAWAAKCEVPVHLLEQSTETREVRPVATGSVSVDTIKDAHTPRIDALKLLELLTDHEIKSIVIPVLLSTMLLRSRA
ncbi:MULTISPECIES: hypothetical protein [unclassified Rubrivivax]|uniref:hypothetical protein n=1 Tax=unclassified Rubrivivax TaxID=2649762 RepID=UPI001E6035AE|nr:MULTISPECIES: hypothetical protein [unclassified Rubrivivax]MCC9597952.1 hypothetical protein [Rubrivivax sp. JA1055]MCC9645791.1 hypothetical protein [Rubrivivax sp. JA1029]